MPLERFQSPSERDDSEGTNRGQAERCEVAAANDHEAVRAWLRLRIEGTHTWLADRKEAERLLLWAVMERRKPLSSLDGDDCGAYRDFLASPGPERTGPRNVQRRSEAWRRGVVGAVTCHRHGHRALAVRLARAPPLPRLEPPGTTCRGDPTRPRCRSCGLCRRNSGNWRRCGSTANLPRRAPPALHRLKFILDFAYMTGMRLAALAAARIGWLRHEQLDDGEWAGSIMVLSKRNK